FPIRERHAAQGAAERVRLGRDARLRAGCSGGCQPAGGPNTPSDWRAVPALVINARTMPGCKIGWCCQLSPNQDPGIGGEEEGDLRAAPSPAPAFNHQLPSGRIDAPNDAAVLGRSEFVAEEQAESDGQKSK